MNGAGFVDLAPGDTFGGLEAQLRARLTEIYVNQALGIAASIASNRNANELAKHMARGEDEEVHKFAAKNIGVLFERGALGIRHFDKKAISGQRWIVSFVRVFARFIFATDSYLATITLKEGNHINNLYSVEAVDITRDAWPERTPRGANQNGPNAAPFLDLASLMKRSIAYYVGDCNRTQPKFVNCTETFSIARAAELLTQVCTSDDRFQKMTERTSNLFICKSRRSMRVADYIFRTLADRGVRHAFLVVGGGAMQLNDALRLEKRITPVSCHHEQACAIAAEGYYRASGKLPVVSVTTGPGGTNAMTGLIGAWLDSIPMIVISGQVKFSTTIASCPEIGLRQLGDQEINIIDIVRPVTKYAKMVTDPNSIGEELATALHEATTGRPGPVWLDIPLNVQGALIDEKELLPIPAFQKDEYPITGETTDQFVKLLSEAKRPVIIAGHGIKLSHAEAEFFAFIEKTRIPIVTTFNGFDIMPSNHPLYFGRIGTIGQRRANFVLQNADLLISIGSRNNIRQISYNWENFAKNAKKIVVDIDPRELKKPTLVPDLAVSADAGRFLSRINGVLAAETFDFSPWFEWCSTIRAKYNPHTPDQESCACGVNPYHMTAVMSAFCPARASVAIGNGTVSIAAFQTWKVKAGQQVFCNSGCASMGYDLPAALGAAVATGDLTVCLAGDGSLMMNLQELATVAYRKLPMKVFLFDNEGYTSIRQTQGNLFSKEFIGCDKGSGVGFPDFAALGKAFGFAVSEIKAHTDIEPILGKVFSTREPEFIIVKIPPELGFSPKLSARRLPDGTMVSPSLEDMFPFLSREEMAENVCKI